MPTEQQVLVFWLIRFQKIKIWKESLRASFFNKKMIATSKKNLIGKFV